MKMNISSHELALVLNISQRRVQQLTNEGILTKNDDETYDISVNANSYFEYKFRPKESVDLEKERALHERAKREKTEMLNAKLKNQLHDANDIEIVITNMLVMFRNRILGIPSRLAPKIIGQKSINIISKEIEKELKEALMELTDYNPKMFSIDRAEGEDNAEKDN